jgi:DNA repair ATPase RecN
VVGSTASIIIHTLLFLFFFASHWIFSWPYDFILLVLTTVVSLEAIYISIFIQRAVNQQSVRLQEVEETLDDVEETLDDVEETLDDVEDSIDEDLDDVQSMQDVLVEMKKVLKEIKTLNKDQKVVTDKTPTKKA